MSEDERYQLIENYLKGALGNEEKNAFEKVLSTDAELSKRVRLHQLANELVIENRLQNITLILLQEKNKGNSGNKFTKFIFGTIILTIGTILFFTWKNKNTLPEASITDNEQTPIESNIAPTESEQLLTTNHKKTTYRKQSVESDQTPLITSFPIERIVPGNSEPILLPPEEKGKNQKGLPGPMPIQEKIMEGPCAAVQLSANISTSSSCKEEATGSIVVSDFTGGTPPYSITIRNKQQEDVSFMNIAAGVYSVLIQDKKGCSNTIQEIQVPEKLCEKEYTINPFMDELITFPTQEQYGTLTIYERSGNPYFTKEIEPSETIQWNGYSKNGELNTGYFIFVITLKDGQTIKGGITLVR